MPKLFKSLVSFLPLFVIFACLTAAGADDSLPTESWFMEVLKFISSAKGMSVAAAVAGVVQLLALLFKTPLSNFSGKWRLAILHLLTAIGMVIGAVASGGSWIAALFSAPVFGFLQTGIYELVKQLTQKDPVPSLKL